MGGTTEEIDLIPLSLTTMHYLLPNSTRNQKLRFKKAGLTTALGGVTKTYAWLSKDDIGDNKADWYRNEKKVEVWYASYTSESQYLYIMKKNTLQDIFIKDDSTDKFFTRRDLTSHAADRANDVAKTVTDNFPKMGPLDPRNENNLARQIYDFIPSVPSVSDLTSFSPFSPFASHSRPHTPQPPQQNMPNNPHQTHTPHNPHPPHPPHPSHPSQPPHPPHPPQLPQRSTPNNLDQNHNAQQRNSFPYANGILSFTQPYAPQFVQEMFVPPQRSRESQKRNHFW